MFYNSVAWNSGNYFSSRISVSNQMKMQVRVSHSVWFALLVFIAVRSALPSFISSHEIHFRELDSWTQFLSEFVDGNGLAKKHIFLGVAEARCHNLLYSPAFIGLQRHVPREIAESLIVPASEFPWKSDACAEILHISRNATISATHARTSTFYHVDLNSWIRTQTLVSEWLLENQFVHSIDVFWHEEGRAPIFQTRILPGASIKLSSYLGHVFSVNMPTGMLVDALGNDVDIEPRSTQRPPGLRGLLDLLIVDGQPRVLGSQGHSGVADCVRTGVSARQCFDEALAEQWSRQRRATNFIQPQLLRRLSSTGYLIHRLEDGLFRRLERWAYPRASDDPPDQLGEHSWTEVHEEVQRDVLRALSTWLLQGPDFAHLADTSSLHLLEDIPLAHLRGVEGPHRVQPGAADGDLRVADPATQVLTVLLLLGEQSADADEPADCLLRLQLPPQTAEQEQRLALRPGEVLLFESASLPHALCASRGWRDVLLLRYIPATEWAYDFL